MPSLAIAVFRCGAGRRHRRSSKNGAVTPSPQIVLHSPDGGAIRRQLLPKQMSAKSPSRARLAELAGGTTAECAAVCCCCPCGIVNLVMLAVVKLPAGLARKAIARRKRKGAGLLPQEQQQRQQQLELVKRYDDMELAELERMVAEEACWPGDKSPSVVVVEMEEEMWVQLYGTGFWRNPSERESELELEL